MFQLRWSNVTDTDDIHRQIGEIEAEIDRLEYEKEQLAPQAPQGVDG